MRVLIPLVFLLISCNRDEVSGIKICASWTSVQSYSENRQLVQLIKKTINKDDKALKQLISINCGGPSGCNDLGSVIDQIIHKIGEENFISMLPSLTANEKVRLRELIEGGLEYGFRLDKTKENGNIKNEFAKIDTFL